MSGRKVGGVDLRPTPHAKIQEQASTGITEQFHAQATTAAVVFRFSARCTEGFGKCLLFLCCVACCGAGSCRIFVIVKLQVWRSQSVAKQQRAVRSRILAVRWGGKCKPHDHSKPQ